MEGAENTVGLLKKKVQIAGVETARPENEGTGK